MNPFDLELECALTRHLCLQVAALEAAQLPVPVRLLQRAARVPMSVYLRLCNANHESSFTVRKYARIAVQNRIAQS